MIVNAINAANPKLKLIKRELTELEYRKSLVKHKFDLGSLMSIAKEYKTRADLKRGNEPAYNFACRHGLIDQICAHMLSKSQAQAKSLTKWTKERVIASAQNFRTSRDWATGEGSAYNAARKNNWLEDACWHMPTRAKK